MAIGKELFDQQVNVLDRCSRPLSIRIQTSPLRDDGRLIIGGLQTFHVIDRPGEDVLQELTLFELRKNAWAREPSFLPAPGRDRKDRSRGT